MDTTDTDATKGCQAYEFGKDEYGDNAEWRCGATEDLRDCKFCNRPLCSSHRFITSSGEAMCPTRHG